MPCYNLNNLITKRAIQLKIKVVQMIGSLLATCYETIQNTSYHRRCPSVVRKPQENEIGSGTQK